MDFAKVNVEVRRETGKGSARTVARRGQGARRCCYGRKRRADVAVTLDAASADAFAGQGEAGATR